MNKTRMVTVVGAGPVGLVAAKELQEKGWETTVIEDHGTIGTPVNCTGIMSVSGLEDAGILKQAEEVLVNKIKGATIFSPNHEAIEVKRSEPVALVVDRGEFDRVLAREAEEQGVEIRLNTRLIDVRNETIFVEHQGRGEILKSKLVIGADGVNSKTRSIMGFSKGMNDFVHAYQVVAEGNFDKKMVQVFLGDYSKNFFAWVVPESEERARIGLASTSGNIRKDFNVFVSGLSLKSNNYCEKCSSLIPVGEPLKNIVKGNMLLAGDAAFQTKATTGGGILTGIIAARKAANSIDGYFKNNAPLKNYEKSCGELNKELKLHWKMRKYMNNFSEDEWDKFFRKMNKSKIGDFLSKHGNMDKPSLFIGKALMNPGMWRIYPDLMRFMRT